MPIGAKEHGQKELIALGDGHRESEKSGLKVKNRGLPHGPKLGVGDGALGFLRTLFKV